MYVQIHICRAVYNAPIFLRLSAILQYSHQDLSSHTGVSHSRREPSARCEELVLHAWDHTEEHGCQTSDKRWIQRLSEPLDALDELLPDRRSGLGSLGDSFVQGIFATGIEVQLRDWSMSLHEI
jgi:hypothetical protein